MRRKILIRSLEALGLLIVVALLLSQRQTEPEQSIPKQGRRSTFDLPKYIEPPLAWKVLNGTLPFTIDGIGLQTTLHELKSRHPKGQIVYCFGSATFCDGKFEVSLTGKDTPVGFNGNSLERGGRPILRVGQSYEEVVEVLGPLALAWDLPTHPAVSSELKSVCHEYWGG